MLRVANFEEDALAESFIVLMISCTLVGFVFFFFFWLPFGNWSPLNVLIVFSVCFHGEREAAHLH